LKVVESVNELAQIMKDLSVLVIDQVYKILINCHGSVLITGWGQTFDFFFEQGTIVDRIDYNIQNVAASVEEGYKQLQKVSSSNHLYPH
jgi:syntaxin 16